MMRLLVDTSAYSAQMRGHREIAEASRLADELVMTPIVLGELVSGFLRGKHRAANRTGLDQFLVSSRVSVVSITEATADRYAIILDALRRVGRPVPTNDLWIAASAMEHGLAVLTTDADFIRIDQIVVRHFDP